MMDWLVREWRAIVAMMMARGGPKDRPFWEVFVYVMLLFLAVAWVVLRLDWIGVF